MGFLIINSSNDMVYDMYFQSEVSEDYSIKILICKKYHLSK